MADAVGVADAVGTPDAVDIAAGPGARAARAAHPWQHRLALAALVLPLPVVGEMLKAGLSAPALVGPVLLLAVPPVLRANRARFMTACVILAVLLLGWSVFGAGEGTWIFLPSALLLLCATFADPRASEVSARVFTVLAVIIAVIPLLGFAGSLMALLGG